MGEYMPGATIVIHGKPWAGWPDGEPQSVRDAYDRMQAEKKELSAEDGSDGALSACREAR